jgi:hypothetical protein
VDFRSAMRAAVNSDGTAFVNVLTYLVQSNPFMTNVLVSERVAQRSLMRFVGILVGEFKVSRFARSASCCMFPHILVIAASAKKF